MIGVGIAVWAPLVPHAKARLGLDDAQLGTLLLGLGIGGLVALPLAGPLVQARGPRIVMLTAGLLFCALMPALALAPSPLLLAVTLTVMGASAGAVDIAMNAQAAAVEQATGRTLMSGFHGAYSLGGLLGSLAMAALLAAGVPPAACAALLGGACALALIARAATMLPRARNAAPPRLILPRGRLAGIGALCFIAFLLEGTILDWSGVFIRFVLHQDAAGAGLGFAALSVAMTIGRLTGDAIVRRFAAVPVLIAGSALAAAGFALAAAWHTLPAFLAGCALVGLGLANMVPILFSAAGRTPGIAASAAIAAAATPGYAGLLAGPVAVGWVAAGTSLPVAFAALAMLAAVIGLAARQAIKK
ncbi:MAG: MFS transporter [Acetobacteraceae bacterium]|nr:MFS transporter [Acetobacteraceae bacterium]